MFGIGNCNQQRCSQGTYVNLESYKYLHDSHCVRRARSTAPSSHAENGLASLDEAQVFAEVYAVLDALVDVL